MSAVSDAIHRIGVARRRQGVITGIRRVRDEQAARRELNGGEYHELNEKIVACSQRIDALVAKAEKQLLG